MSDNFNKNRLAKNTILLYVRMLFTMWLNLYTTRLTLANLGVEDMGIYGVVGSIVSMFAVFSGGMGNAVQRFLTYEIGRCHLKETLAKYVFDETNEPEEPAEQEPNAPNIQEEVLGTKQTEYFNMELLSLIHVTCVGEQFENISEHDFYTCMNLLPSDTKPQIRPREKIRTCYLIFLMSEKLPKQDRENWKRNILKILDIEESYYKSKYKEPVSDFPSDSNRKFAKEMDGIFR